LIILSLDTSCDETAVAITCNTKVLSNAVWSQISLHSKFGGVMPSLAQRAHEERIDFITNKAIKKSGINIKDVDAIAVTIGPGLAIALGVGINKAKKLAKQYNKPLIPINHVEAHLLSSFATSSPNTILKISFPALGLVISGGTTELILINDIGKYEVLAETVDDALGEALDKAARLLGFGYPGGAILEKIAKNGKVTKYSLPLPLVNDKEKNRFSYSGLKTAFVRLYEKEKKLNKQDISDLASTFQDTAFEHIINVLKYQIIKIQNQKIDIKDLLLGGGVANNVVIKNKLRKLCREKNLKLHIPYTKKLNEDNAAMIGVCAYLKTKDESLIKYLKFERVDRNPKLNLRDKSS